MARFLAKLVAATSVITVLTYFTALAVSVGLLAFTHIGQDLLNNARTLRLGAFLIRIDTPYQVNLLGSFLVLLGIYVACFAISVRSNGGFLPNVRSLVNGSLYQRIPNWLVVMPLVSSAIFVVVVTISLFLNALGASVGSLLQLEPYQLLYSLAYAAPVEETMFRISTLGLLVAVRAAWSVFLTPVANRRRLARLVALSFLFPDRAKVEAGLPHIANSKWHALHWSEWLVLILTSVVFGVDHFLANIGWDIGKALTASLQGLALGLAYLSYGAYASILLHWFYDLYFGTFIVANMVLGGVFPIISAIVSFWAIVAGVVGIVAILTRLSSGRHNATQTPYSRPDALSHF